MTENGRQALLSQKLMQNLQRRGRERYLDDLPSDIANYLIERECLYTPELDNFINLWYPLPTDGHLSNGSVLLNYQSTTVYYPDQALRLAETFDKKHDSLAAVFYTWRECPGFIVEFGWIRSRFATLWNYSPQLLALVCSNLQAGIVIDNYVTYPEDHNPNPEEAAYEVALWSSGVIGQSL